MTEIIKEEQPSVWSFFCELLMKNYQNDNEAKDIVCHHILEKDDSKLLINHIEKFVKDRLANAITTSQLRKLFAIVKDKKLSLQLNEVRIHLIYIAARQNNPAAQEFAQFTRQLIARIGDDKIKLNRFQLFIESIVSYHRYYSKR